MKKIFTNKISRAGLISLFASFIILIVAISVLLGTSSCAKQNTNCGASVTIDSSGTPVAGVTVLLWAPHGQVSATGITGSTGIADFNFANPAIFNITATKAIGPNDTLKGSGIIQLQIGNTVSATVTLQ